GGPHEARDDWIADPPLAASPPPAPPPPALTRRAASTNDRRRNPMSPNGFSPANVIVVGFADDDRAYEAMTTLNQLASQGQIGLAEAAGAHRGESVPQTRTGAT